MPLESQRTERPPLLHTEYRGNRERYFGNHDNWSGSTVCPILPDNGRQGGNCCGRKSRKAQKVPEKLRQGGKCVKNPGIGTALGGQVTGGVFFHVL